jgi:hypothetical protein
MNETGTNADQGPFVFIVGCARSGTTLLQRIVNAHPQIAVTPEMDWITDSFRTPRWLGPEGRLIPEQVASLIKHKRFRQLEFSQAEFQDLLGAGEVVPYVTFLNCLFALYGRKKGKCLVGSKTPPYVLRIRTLHEVWPRARFVHLIRDGRDVCLSVLNWNHADRTAGVFASWSEDPVSTTALWWERKVRQGRQQGKALGPDFYHEIRYEDLVAHPADECAKLCAFLRVPLDGAMLRFHEAPPPPNQHSHPWSPITPGLRNWRCQMPAADIERFETAVGDLLSELGYARAYPNPSPERREHAARIRNVFVRDDTSRKETLREGEPRTLG